MKMEEIINTIKCLSMTMKSLADATNMRLKKIKENEEITNERIKKIEEKFLRFTDDFEKFKQRNKYEKISSDIDLSSDEEDLKDEINFTKCSPTVCTECKNLLIYELNNKIYKCVNSSCSRNYKDFIETCKQCGYKYFQKQSNKIIMCLNCLIKEYEKPK